MYVCINILQSDHLDAAEIVRSLQQMQWIPQARVNIFNPNVHVFFV